MSLWSRYGMCGLQKQSTVRSRAVLSHADAYHAMHKEIAYRDSSERAETTLPRAARLELIAFASFKAVPVLPVRRIRSDPARSTRASVALMVWLVWSFWRLDLCLFFAVAAEEPGARYTF